MIELDNVCCTFKKGRFTKEVFTAVSAVSLTFERGERYAIVGESGSGKTTLARMLAGLQVPSDGELRIDKKNVYQKKGKKKEHFKRIQLIGQNSAAALDPKMSVGRAIEEPLQCFFAMDRKSRKKRCEQLLELCNLPKSYMTRLPSELSGGEQKRVAIARALAVEPDCLIFDEATNGFDLPLRKKIVEEIMKLQDELGFLLIFITHDIELALAVADKIFVMKDSVMEEKVTYTGDVHVFEQEYSRLLLKAGGLL